MSTAEVEVDQDVVEGVLVDELPHLPVQVRAARSVDRELSPVTLRRIAAATPFNTLRAYARTVYGRKVHLGEDGQAVDAGPAGAPAPEVDWSWLAWLPWCELTGRTSGEGAEPATAETLAQWASEMVDAGVGARTIKQAIYAVRRFHRDHKHKGHPETRPALDVLRTYRRSEGGAKPVDRAKPLTLKPLRLMLKAMPGAEEGQLTVLGVRDSLILVVGVLGMLRRSELVALDIEHVKVDDRAVTLWIAASKTDQDAEGAKVVIPKGENPRVDVTVLMRDWLALLAEQGHTSGPLLRSVNRHGRITGRLQADGQDIDRLVKAAAVRAGLDPKGWKGHSLRAGGATAAYEGGASYSALMRQGRWKSLAQLLEYIREVDEYNDNAASHIHL